MARSRKTADAAINTEGWMMSYADMATILLAMFIVLSTLGKDQTGASLQKGLESYRESRQTFGFPGMFDTTGRAINLSASGPRYNLHHEDDPSRQGNTAIGVASNGPDDEKREGVSIDQEKEQFQHFVKELERQFDVKRMPYVTGQATVDLFDPLNKHAPLLTAKHKEALSPVIGLLKRDEYRLMVVAWATMSKDSALLRAAEQAQSIAKEIIDSGHLDEAASRRLMAVAKTWPYADYQRPVFSLVVAKTHQAQK
jgi:Membrane MotB of proton-channel complex MotA/MotB